MNRTAAAVCSAALLTVGLAAAPIALAQTDPVVELCVATSVEEVDAVLSDLDATALDGPLAPLLALVVPATDGGFLLRADVTSNDVRQALDCDTPLDPAEPDLPVDPTVPTTPVDPETEPTTTPAPSPTPSTSDSEALDPLDDDGTVADTDGTQITIVPRGSADTGSP